LSFILKLCAQTESWNQWGGFCVNIMRYGGK